MSKPGAFVREQTVLGRAPLVPEIALHLATEVTPIWQATEAWLAARNIDPPYWAFAWPGGQALARYVLDQPARVRGRRVLDFAAGCGIAAIACARAGAALVEAAEIDALAVAAIGENAVANGVTVLAATDVVGAPCRWDLILAGDVCYEAPMTTHVLPWLRRMAAECEVWLADPGRAYLPRSGLVPLARYIVPTTLELECRTERETWLYRLETGGARGDRVERAQPSAVPNCGPGPLPFPGPAFRQVHTEHHTRSATEVSRRNKLRGP